MLTQREKVARHGPGTDRTDTDPLRRMPVDKMVILLEARGEYIKQLEREMGKLEARLAAQEAYIERVFGPRSTEETNLC